MSTYISEADAEIYFSGRLNADAWDNALTAERVKALTHSTRLIDQLNFKGRKNSDDQELQFPRYNDSTVPVAIQYATAELALALLDGVDPDLEYENVRMTHQSFGRVSEKFDTTLTAEPFLAGIPSFQAWRYLRPYLRDYRSIRLKRTS